MEDKIIYGVKDTHYTKSKYGDIYLITTPLSMLPKAFNKYIDTKKSYRNTYCFSTMEKAKEFENELWNKYHTLKKQENLCNWKIDRERLTTLLFNAIVYLEQDFDDKEQLLKELGMTKKEYKEIMGE